MEEGSAGIGSGTGTEDEAAGSLVAVAEGTGSPDVPASGGGSALETAGATVLRSLRIVATTIVPERVSTRPASGARK